MVLKKQTKNGVSVGGGGGEIVKDTESLKMFIPHIATDTSPLAS